MKFQITPLALILALVFAAMSLNDRMNFERVSERSLSWPNEASGHVIERKCRGCDSRYYTVEDSDWLDQYFKGSFWTGFLQAMAIVALNQLETRWRIYQRNKAHIKK